MTCRACLNDYQSAVAAKFDNAIKELGSGILVLLRLTCAVSPGHTSLKAVLGGVNGDNGLEPADELIEN